MELLLAVLMTVRVQGNVTVGARNDGCAATGGAPAVDTCSDTPVNGLSLTELAVHQSVKVSIMKSMQAVQAGQRNADVIEGRPR